MKFRHLITATALAPLLVLSACKAGKEKEADPAKAEAVAPKSEGTWAAATRKPLVGTTSAVGSFKPRQMSKLGTQVTGRVREVHVDVGDRVRKGQELLRLDPVRFELQLAQGEAEYKAAKSAYEDTKLNYERMKNLWDKPDGTQPTIARKLYDDAKTRYDEAAARFEKADKALAYTKQELRDTGVYAPYDGVITARYVDPGEPVTSTPVTHVLEIQDSAVLELEFSLPQESIAYVKAGTSIEFDVEGVPGSAGKANIDVVYPDVDVATRSFRCRVLVDNRDNRYRSGMLVNVRVTEELKKDALVVPRDAVKTSGGKSRVQIRGQSGPEYRPVETGSMTDTEVEIVSGLSDGESVLLPGAGR